MNLTISRNELQNLLSFFPKDKSVDITVTSDVSQLEKELTLSCCIKESSGYKETGELLLGNPQIKFGKHELVENSIPEQQKKEFIEIKDSPAFDKTKRLAFAVKRHEWNCQTEKYSCRLVIYSPATA